MEYDNIQIYRGISIMKIITANNTFSRHDHTALFQLILKTFHFKSKSDTKHLNVMSPTFKKIIETLG